MSIAPEQTSDPVIEKNTICYDPIFPISMARVDIELPVEDMARDILQLETDVKHAGGFITTNIEHISGYQELRTAIHSIALNFVREHKYEVNQDRSSITLWASIMRKGNYQGIFNHPHNHFSGIFFVKVNEKSSPIVMHSPTACFRMHEPVITNPENIGPFTAHALNLSGKDNTLLMWPSWLNYQVPPITDDEPRIAISFNIDYLPVGS